MGLTDLQHPEACPAQTATVTSCEVLVTALSLLYGISPIQIADGSSSYMNREILTVPQPTPGGLHQAE